MTVGLSAANTANKLLNTIGRTGTTFTAGSLYVQLHTGDPGSAGTANASAVTTRYAVTFSAAGTATAGSMALTSMGGTYAMTGTETISHISLWDASTAGNFMWSVALTASKSVINGDTLSLTSLTLAFTPIAA
jgi:hypothetical protein